MMRGRMLSEEVYALQFGEVRLPGFRVKSRWKHGFMELRNEAGEIVICCTRTTGLGIAAAISEYWAGVFDDGRDFELIQASDTILKRILPAPAIATVAAP